MTTSPSGSLCSTCAIDPRTKRLSRPMIRLCPRHERGEQLLRLLIEVAHEAAAEREG